MKILLMLSPWPQLILNLALVVLLSFISKRFVRRNSLSVFIGLVASFILIFIGRHSSVLLWRFWNEFIVRSMQWLVCGWFITSDPDFGYGYELIATWIVPPLIAFYLLRRYDKGEEDRHCKGDESEEKNRSEKREPNAKPFSEYSGDR